jgi:hypothetical protein
MIRFSGRGFFCEALEDRSGQSARRPAGPRHVQRELVTLPKQSGAIVSLKIAAIQWRTWNW